MIRRSFFNRVLILKSYFLLCKIASDRYSLKQHHSRAFDGFSNGVMTNTIYREKMYHQSLELAKNRSQNLKKNCCRLKCMQACHTNSKKRILLNKLLLTANAVLFLSSEF